MKLPLVFLQVNRPLLSPALLAGLLAVASCGGHMSAESNTSGEPEVDFSGGGIPAWLQDSVNARWIEAYRGIRRVSLYYEMPGVEYREDVGADGLGNFDVAPIEVLSSHPDPDTFLTIQTLRATLAYRYRDFAITDWDLFQLRYGVTILDDTRSVAGIPTTQLRIERLTDARCYYEVDFDTSTGLVLAYKEYDPGGQLMADVAYESFAYDADLSGLTLIPNLFTTTSHSMAADDLEAVFGFAPLVPTYVPPGYIMLDGVDEQNAPDGTRAKVYLTDGVETIILGSQIPVLNSGSPHGRVFSLSLGPWTGLKGDVSGYPVLIAGRVESPELSLILQSALGD